VLEKVCLHSPPLEQREKIVFFKIKQTDCSLPPFDVSTTQQPENRKKYPCGIMWVFANGI